MNCLSVKIDNLSYSTVEHEIANYYDMGYPDSSGFPIEFDENEHGTYMLSCTRKSGNFSIRITKQPDGKYWLFVAPSGKITNNR